MTHLTLLFPELYRLARADQRRVFAGATIRLREDGSIPSAAASEWYCVSRYEPTPDPVLTRFVERLLRRRWLSSGGSRRALDAP